MSRGGGTGVAALLVMITTANAQEPPVTPTSLQGAQAFAEITDDTERAVALFTEIGKVIQHPRCMNCHPRESRPLQGDGRLHDPPVVRGSGGMGVPGMTCNVCHGRHNADLRADFSLPGNPAWHLAPAEMGWVGLSLAQICEQLKDPARNGGKSLEQIVQHMADDELVAWGWAPGAGREPAPGDQATLGALTRAWVDSGAHCPPR